uniref:Uncharacterized protein n=1 Tax=viral metagenome TaxID=1070528 RepID=A0A6C0ECA1_9ZZZZ
MNVDEAKEWIESLSIDDLKLAMSLMSQSLQKKIEAKIKHETITKLDGLKEYLNKRRHDGNLISKLIVEYSKNKCVVRLLNDVFEYKHDNLSYMLHINNNLLYDDCIPISHVTSKQLYIDHPVLHYELSNIASTYKISTSVFFEFICDALDYLISN